MEPVKVTADSVDTCPSCKAPVQVFKQDNGTREFIYHYKEFPTVCNGQPNQTEG